MLTHKVLLLQYKYEVGQQLTVNISYVYLYHVLLFLMVFCFQTQVLRTVLGYLASDRDRRPLLIQVHLSKHFKDKIIEFHFYTIFSILYVISIICCMFQHLIYMKLMRYTNMVFMEMSSDNTRGKL